MKMKSRNMMIIFQCYIMLQKIDIKFSHKGNLEDNKTFKQLLQTKMMHKRKKSMTKTICRQIEFFLKDKEENETLNNIVFVNK